MGCKMQIRHFWYVGMTIFVRFTIFYQKGTFRLRKIKCGLWNNPIETLLFSRNDTGLLLQNRQKFFSINTHFLSDIYPIDLLDFFSFISAKTC